MIVQESSSESCVLYNRVLSGPNNEGLLVVRDDMATHDVTQVRASHWLITLFEFISMFF